MPVALLLQSTFRSLATGARAMGTWGRMVALEELLLERARSAFLVSWFGERLPMEGFALRISLTNLDALRRRFAAVQAAVPSAEGINLTEPLAGMAGTLAGIMSAPFQALGVGIALAVLGPSWLTRMLGALHAATFGTLTGALGVMAFPLAIVGILVLAASDPRVGQAYRLLGAIAELLSAARAFVEQLLGPRVRVRNPLVRAVLGLLDRLAGIVALLIGLAALVFARLQPLILPLVDQALALLGLGRAVLSAVGAAVEDLLSSLSLFAEGEHSPAAAVFEVISAVVRMVEVVAARFTELVGWATSVFTALGAGLTARMLAFLATATAALDAAVLGHPLGQALERAAAIMPAVVSALRAIGAAVVTSLRRTPVIGGLLSGSGGSGGAGSGGGVGAFIYSLGPPIPTPPAAPEATAVAAIVGRPALSGDLDTVLAEAERSPTYVFLSEEAMAELERMRRGPANPFAPGRLALGDAAGRSAAEQLAELRADQLPLRELLAAVVGRVLPAAAAPYVRSLDDLFHTVDRELFGMPEGMPPRRELPVRALDQSDRLRLEVGRLRVRVAEADAAGARAWAGELGDTLRGQAYIAANTPEG